MERYIHHTPNWPHFEWDTGALLSRLSEVRYLQGRLLGKMEGLGFSIKEEAVLENLTLEVTKSNEIEGEQLDLQQVRSSIARKLGMDISGLVPSDRHVDGVVEMSLDATQQYALPLTAKRLFGWHAALFPTGYSGMWTIDVGAWRKDKEGPMRVVSGPMGKEKIHFEAPAAALIPQEMERFLNWFNAPLDVDPVLKAAVAHFWFITLHPFDDGNGRIARAIADMALARADDSPQRFYSMSAQIRAARKQYYTILETTQSGSLNITVWMEWFLECLKKSLLASEEVLAGTLAKARFWERHLHTQLNPRQRKVINRLLDGFEGKLKTSKWAKMTKCSTDTALRDIQDLVRKEILIQEASGGRSTSYQLVLE